MEKTRNITIEKPKKVVPKQYKWLVCIPDGLVVEKDKSGSTSIVEVKCPHKCKDAKLGDVAKSDDVFFLELHNGKLRLKKDHDYYYQIQGMLNMMSLKICYFGVWTPTEFHSEIVTRDKNLWNSSMFPELLEFYRIFILDNKWKLPDMDDVLMEHGKTNALLSLSVSEYDARKIEMETKGQSSNDKWKQYRSNRLTASNFGRVCKMRASTHPHNTVVSILYPENIDHLPAIKHGKVIKSKIIFQK